MTFTDQIVVELSSNTVLSYLDSGPPNSSSNYETIILIHGNSFSNAIFKRLMPLCTKFNLRIVAPSRRGFPGSTPFSPSELALFSPEEIVQEAASHEMKARFLELRAVEILRFIDGFIQRSSIPPISASSSPSPKGGIGLIGWSLGSTFSMAAVAHMDSSLVSDEMRNRLGQYLRTHIMLEPSITSLGLPFPPAAWIPFRDPNIPLHAQGPLFCNLVTGYFDYSEEILSARNVTASSTTIAPSHSRIPTIYNFTQDEYDEIINLTEESTPDLYYSKVLQSQIRDSYLRACYDRKLRFENAGLRNMKTVWEVVGTRSHGMIWPTFWEIENDDLKAGEGEKEKFVRFKILEGANHFMQWDEPDMTMQAFRECLDASY
ncbi:hypothetical protein GYMLUDRAFT_259998 [Collybiopsis luxurians FD-317 M1]|uniref:AB hydrolase-1 domain-containing protein n=1 Tax=Collybiopsis luxurians FD-317 M1 TaxID=944289 RepID=A0A0D0CJ12_9AGAR|nr:hypothetical protein GYMLUDRAFT_259998 [Collybiopsis luxurians FD-317 M1]